MGLQKDVLCVTGPEDVRRQERGFFESIYPARVIELVSVGSMPRWICGFRAVLGLCRCAHSFRPQ